MEPTTLRTNDVYLRRPSANVNAFVLNVPLHGEDAFLGSVRFALSAFVFLDTLLLGFGPSAGRNGGRGGGGGGGGAWQRPFEWEEEEWEEEQALVLGWLEEQLERRAGLEGRACVRRLVCEMQQNPVRRDATVLADAIRLLMPRNASRSGGPMEPYREAQEAARNASCSDVFSSCPFSLFGL